MKAKGDVVTMIETGEYIYPFFQSTISANKITTWTGESWKALKAAQQSVHLTAFGVGMLAAIAIYFVGLIALLRKYGGR